MTKGTKEKIRRYKSIVKELPGIQLEEVHSAKENENDYILSCKHCEREVTRFAERKQSFFRYCPYCRQDLKETIDD